MLTPSMQQINEASRMDAGVIDHFLCGLCRYVVTPYPQECPACNRLYCQQCVEMQRRWECNNTSCRSRAAPTKMHNAVQEILDLVMFICPGCDKKMRYKQMFDHVKQC